MKKLLVILLLIALLISIVSCNDSQKDINEPDVKDQNATEKPTESEKATEKEAQPLERENYGCFFIYFCIYQFS